MFCYFVVLFASVIVVADFADSSNVVVVTDSVAVFPATSMLLL